MLKEAGGERHTYCVFHLFKILENECQQHGCQKRAWRVLQREGEGLTTKAGGNLQGDGHDHYLIPGVVYFTLKNLIAHLNYVQFIIYQLLLNKAVKK